MLRQAAFGVACHMNRFSCGDWSVPSVIMSGGSAVVLNWVPSTGIIWSIRPLSRRSLMTAVTPAMASALLMADRPLVQLRGSTPAPVALPQVVVERHRLLADAAWRALRWRCV